MGRCEANGFPGVSRPTAARYWAPPQRLLAPMAGYRDRVRAGPPRAARRLRVAAALRAEAERAALGRRAAACPPFLPPFRAGARFTFRPRPDPLFLPPPVSAFTVAQARRAASLLRDSALLVAFLDVPCLSLLLLGVG